MILEVQNDFGPAEWFQRCESWVLACRRRSPVLEVQNDFGGAERFWRFRMIWDLRNGFGGVKPGCPLPPLLARFGGSE